MRPLSPSGEGKSPYGDDAEPAQTRALKGRKRRAKNDRLDARWLAFLLANEMLPTSWIPPEEIRRLRDLTRLRQALRHGRTRWAQRLHSTPRVAAVFIVGNLEGYLLELLPPRPHAAARYMHSPPPSPTHDDERP